MFFIIVNGWWIFMNKMNRGAMTNLRHILYDIAGNIIAYLLCHGIFMGIYYRHDISPENTFLAACLYTLIFILCSQSMKLYDITMFYYTDRVIRIVIISCVFATAAVSTVFYFSGRAQTNREFYLLYYFLSVAAHLIACYLSFLKNRRYSVSVHTLLIGRKESFERFHQYIRKTNVPIACSGYMLLSSEGKDNSSSDGYLGCVENGDLEHILCNGTIDQVYIMHEPNHSVMVNKCVNICMELGIVTRVVFPMAREDCASYISSVGTYPIISYHMGSMNTCEQAVKRLMDIVGSLVGILVSAPIVLVAAVAIKLDSPGPVFFSQTRAGRNGRRFKILKLRTMTTDAEYRKQELLVHNEMGGAYMFKIKEDPRVTRVGAFLRKTSIDEFPQFINVFFGEMSLVGTRPPTEDEVVQYENVHWRRLRTKPGITGVWQISGRNQITSFDEIVEMDTQYIENWSIFSDIRIILKTILVVLQRKGAS